MEGGDVGRGDRMGGKGCGGRKQEAKSIRTRARGYVIVHHHVNLVRAFLSFYGKSTWNKFLKVMQEP